MTFHYKTICTIFGLLLIASCSSMESNGEEDYVNSDDEMLCGCYQSEHEVLKVDFKSRLSEDFEFWQSKFDQLAQMDFKSLESLYTAFKNNEIQIGSDSSEILGYSNKVNRRIITDCIQRDAMLGNKQAQRIQDFINAGGLGLPLDASRESWLLRVEGYLPFFKGLDDGQWLNPIYLSWVQAAYSEYKEMLEFESAKSAQEKILQEEERIHEKDRPEQLRLPPMPPPPVDEIEEIVPTEPEVPEWER